MNNNNFYYFLTSFLRYVFTAFLYVYLILNGNSTSLPCVHVHIFGYLSINSLHFATADNKRESDTSCEISSEGSNLAQFGTICTIQKTWKTPMEDFFFFNFTKSNTPPLVFSTFSKLCRWYQIAQRITLAETNPVIFHIL